MKPQFRICTTTIAVFGAVFADRGIWRPLKFSMFGQRWLTTALPAANFHDVHHTLLQELGYYSSDVVFGLVLMPVVAKTLVFGVFNFPNNTEVETGDPAARSTTGALNQADALQETIVSDWIKEKRAARR